MVFALLTEVVALQVVLSIIEVWKPSFEGTSVLEGFAPGKWFEPEGTSPSKAS